MALFVIGQCDGCGEWPEQLHLPTKEHGWYCAGCCPVCQQQRAVKAALAHPGGAGKSDRERAKHVGVAPITVGSGGESCNQNRLSETYSQPVPAPMGGRSTPPTSAASRRRFASRRRRKHPCKVAVLDGSRMKWRFLTDERR